MVPMIKNGDFVELDYTGRLVEEDIVFDTTHEKVAKDNSIHHAHAAYHPAIIHVGEHQIVKGLDASLIGKEEGSEYDIELPAEQGFGKKNAKLIQLIPTGKFTKQGISPSPGLQVNIDGQVGTVRKVGGGRTLVDFNHPLAGKDVRYHVTIRRIVQDDAEKVNAVLSSLLPIKDMKVEVQAGSATITLAQDLPQQMKDILQEHVKSQVPSVKGVGFVHHQPGK